jgi:cell surface protein SprA
MFNGRESFDGSYSKTTIALRTAFNSKSQSVRSPLFDQFLANRSIIAARLQSMSGVPSGKFFDINSADVMIPAFVAAYTGGDALKTSTDILPGILSILPNWKVSYDGLIRIGFINKRFKTFTLNHAYRSTYDLTSFSSIANWEPLSFTNNYGLIPETDQVSSPFYIGSVNINETFVPLLGLDASLKNSLLFKVEFRKTRNMQLDIPANQIIESYSNEYVIGSGYRIDDFGLWIGLNSNKQKKVKNDLNIRADISYKTTNAFIRRIEEEFSQLSSGLDAFIIKFMAEYVFSEKLNIRFFYDRTATTPKVSAGFPTVNTNFGIGFRFLLTR